MIKKLNSNYKQKIFNIEDKTPNLMKIKSLLNAYGMKTSFLSFYDNEDFNILVAVKDSMAYTYVSNTDKLDELSAFISLLGVNLLSEEKLSIDGFNEEVGNTYTINTKGINPLKLDKTSNNIQDGYDVLSVIFNNSINEASYKKWYTDVSHRVRHNISRIYTYNAMCSATAYCNVDGDVMIVQLGTLESERGKGMARAMISHIAADYPEADRIVLLSQNATSDKFYEKIGFELWGKWYYYGKN